MVKTTPTLSIAQKLNSETTRFEEKQTIMSELYEVCRNVARVFRKNKATKAFGIVLLMRMTLRKKYF